MKKKSKTVDEVVFIFSEKELRGCANELVKRPSWIFVYGCKKCKKLCRQEVLCKCCDFRRSGQPGCKSAEIGPHVRIFERETFLENVEHDVPFPVEDKCIFPIGQAGQKCLKCGTIWGSHITK